MAYKIELNKHYEEIINTNLKNSGENGKSNDLE
jgi:hypothetical protein